MTYRLKDFTPVVYQLLVIKICGIILILKIEFLGFPVLKVLIKNHSKTPNLVIQSLFKYFPQKPNGFLIVH